MQQNKPASALLGIVKETLQEDFGLEVIELEDGSLNVKLPE